MLNAEDVEIEVMIKEGLIMSTPYVGSLLAAEYPCSVLSWGADCEGKLRKMLLGRQVREERWLEPTKKKK